MLKLERSWTRQPRKVVPLDLTNRINDRVAFVWSPLRPDIPEVGLALTPTNAARAVAQDGVVSRLTAGYWSRANYAPVVTSNGSGTGDFTVVVRANPSASATQQCLTAQRRGSGSFEQFGIIANSTGGGSSSSGAIEYFTFSGTLVGATHAGRVDGRWHTWAMRRVGSVVSFWEDGLQLGSSTGTIQTISHSTSDYAVGANTSAGVFASTCDFSFQWSSNRGLTDVEMAAITRTPWIVYEPQSIWIPVSSAAGTSYAITPSGGIALAGSGLDLRTKVIAPSGGVSFAGTGSATFSAGGTEYTITPSGGVTLAGSGDFLKSKFFTPTGGVSMGGTSEMIKTKIVSPSGGVLFSGTGSMESNTVISTGPTGERTKVGVGT